MGKKKRLYMDTKYSLVGKGLMYIYLSQGFECQSLLLFFNLIIIILYFSLEFKTYPI